MSPATEPVIAQTSADLTDLSAIYNLVASDLADVDKLIREEYKSRVPLVNQIINYIIKPKGKRVRPLALLLMARALGNHEPSAQTLAAMIEFIHTATLLHDDVVDESELRRGRKTANKVWGNAVSVLAGDFMYSRVFQIIAGLENVSIKSIFSSLADATNVMAEGEVIQLGQRYDPDIDEDAYLTMLHYKTGKLFELATHLASLIAGASPALEKAASEYGQYIGIAFQLTDDALDYYADPEKTGKNIGDDLVEGSATMPVIYAYQNAEKEDREIIEQALKTGDINNIEKIQQIIEKTDAIAYTQQLAKQFVDKAIAALANIPDSIYRDGLIALAQFAIARDF